jgi:hypothetical protein
MAGSISGCSITCWGEGEAGELLDARHCRALTRQSTQRRHVLGLSETC